MRGILTCQDRLRMNWETDTQKKKKIKMKAGDDQRTKRSPCLQVQSKQIIFVGILPRINSSLDSPRAKVTHTVAS